MYCGYKFWLNYIKLWGPSGSGIISVGSGPEKIEYYINIYQSSKITESSFAISTNFDWVKVKEKGWFIFANIPLINKEKLSKPNPNHSTELNSAKATQCNSGWG